MKATGILLLLAILISCQNEDDSKEVKDLKEKVEELSNEVDSLNQKSSAREESTFEAPEMEFNTYCNGRYSFCIDYPSDFIAQGESDSGDGQKFLSENGAVEIIAYGALAEEDIFNTLDKWLEYDMADGNVTYKTRGINFYVVSGIEDGKVFYKKVVKRKIDYFDHKDTEILVGHLIQYPEADKAKYDYYCEKIFKDLE